MSTIQGISPIYGGSSGMMANSVSPSTGLTGSGAMASGELGESLGSGSILSLSSTSINATSETLLAANSPMLASNEALGAALLMLVLQYLQAGDPQEKQNLTNMIVGLAGMQQQNQGGGGGGMLLYSSSSLSIESTQLTIATSQGLDAYAGASATLQQAPQADAGAASLDVMA